MKRSALGALPVPDVLSSVQSSDTPLIAAYQVAPDGTARQQSWPLDAGPPSESGYQWVHLQRATEEGDRWLEEESGLPDFAVHALLETETQPRCAKFNEGILLILRGVNLNPESDPEDMVTVRLWVEPHRVISVRLRRLLAVNDIREAMDAQRAPRTVGAFVADLADKLSSRIDKVVGGLADQLDELEEESLAEEAGFNRVAISELRRKFILLRRYVAPQRDALSRLAGTDDHLLSTKERIEVRELLDKTTRLVEELDAARERAAVINDQLMDKRAETMNRNMLVLSVVAAIFLPLGFLTGLLGINVGGIPGAENDLAFWIVCTLLALLSGGLALLFRVLKWI